MSGWHGNAPGVCSRNGLVVVVGGRTKFPREAVQDGETLKLIAKAAAEQVKIVSNNAAG